MCVCEIPDQRFVDPRNYDKTAVYLLDNVLEIPALILDVGRR
jgi:hypothetical protein